MKQLLQNNRYFLLPYVLFLLASFLLLLAYSKPELHILLTQNHSELSDVFFKYLTNLGDGLCYLVLIVILLFISYRYTVIFVVGSLFSNVVVHVSKKLIFAEVCRPSKYFELYETYKLHFVEGVRLHSFHSFPSGHTTTAFNLFFMLALITKNKYAKLFFFVTAVVTGYSRVYLSQHFLIDIVVGSILGTAGILAAWLLLVKSEKPWMDRSILSKRN